MATFQDARDGLDSLLKDGKGNLTREDKDRHIRTAARTFQAKFPQILSVQVAGDGGFEYPLPTGFVDGFSNIQEVYYPYVSTDQDPPRLERRDYRVWDGPSGKRLRFTADKPLATEAFLVVFTAPQDTTETEEAVTTTLSPAGTVVAAGVATSAAYADTAAAAAARVHLHVTALDPGASLDAEVQVSENDGASWSPIGAFNTVSAAGEYILPLAASRVSRRLRLRYTATGGAATVEAVAEVTGVTGAWTIPTHLMHVLEFLAAAICAQALADYYAHLVDSEIQGSTVDYQGKASFWQANAEAWQKRWEEAAAEAPKPRRTGAGGQGEWDLHGTGGYAYLTHDARNR